MSKQIMSRFAYSISSFNTPKRVPLSAPSFVFPATTNRIRFFLSGQNNKQGLCFL